VKSKITFGKKDLIAVLSCVVFLLINLGAVGSGGRERAKRAVCLANLRQLTLAWTQYADDNDDKIVCGDTGEYDNYNPYGNNYHRGEIPWVLKDWFTTDMNVKRDAILNGALFPYCKDVKLYKCPADVRGQLRSYIAVDAMNCKGWPHMGAVMIKTKSEIRWPAKRFVFVDYGGALAIGGWTCYVKEDRWWDPPPIRHSEGTNFSFADGHSEYWQWQDLRTLGYVKPVPPLQPGNIDIRRTQIAAWGPAAGADN